MRFRWNLNLSLTLVDVKLVLLGSGDYWQAPGQVPVDYESSRLLESVNDKGWLIWSSVWQFKWKDYQCTQIAINSFNASPKPPIFTWCEIVRRSAYNLLVKPNLLDIMAEESLTKQYCTIIQNTIMWLLLLSLWFIRYRPFRMAQPSALKPTFWFCTRSDCNVYSSKASKYFSHFPVIIISCIVKPKSEVWVSN